MRRIRVSVGALLGVLVLAGCGSASPDYETAGIDELVIPTPSPDPDDFVGYVDNPWLPLEPGRTITYEVASGGGVGESTLSVEPSNLMLGGVKVTTVRTSTSIGLGMPTETVDYYAQDRDGNVWWFGRAGVWDVTVAGAEAGLAMPADPRVGDGWRLALLDGVVEDRATVDSFADGVLVVRVESELIPGLVEQRVYDKGVGPVRTVIEGPPELTSAP